MKIPLFKIPGLCFSAFLILLILAPFTLAAQQNETKAERKAREKEAYVKSFEVARQLVLDSTFLIPAKTLQFRNGGLMTQVQGTINFLKMDREEAVVQIGSDFSPGPGLNNLGGVTIKGQVRNLKIKEKESKNSMYISFNVTGIVGTAQISISLNGSDKAMVDVDGMFSGRAFSMTGIVQPLNATKTFEGTEF